ncbi:bifunctional 3-(3-hydroxy-phenyl)propionate/3-hydroxycinnamic acid hydroxylase MhpA [Nonomuraea angiospora]|uniref:bifunctional 3-(3-hydroxy-phenyl)propionate/3-hydroxycinnamic acid hydroxylase MhpA n=1 Tax=Nonomuraea angiospora TaxID=46172 RepID=UPI0029BE387F|nr:bifunctional 3-(3-hydroxy-phenyl)propionate/3-hydroxycinnamic acid hydroxylase [Nonomuraea angiospora]MDX3101900.1 bifunctional 3-(3-hydroxy-phenyl)propionate/3-hydroxycinnamic acid hydroxylase [Nonomuraea angiospora]
MQNSQHEVVIVGAGPVGLATARMLGQRGHDVVVVERWPEPYPLPRAVHFDDEIGRVFQSMELAREVAAITEPVPDFYEWRNAAGEALLRIDWSGTGPNGWPTANFFSQPQLEQVLARALDSMPNVGLVRGVDVVDIEEHEDRVVVRAGDTRVGKPGQILGPTRATRSFTARYVIGCDGANSFVRSRMPVEMQDQGFFFDWLIVDTIPTDDVAWSPMNWQLCDPVRPTTIVSGGPGRRRWEFMRLPGEDAAGLATSETAWKLLAAWGRTPDNTHLERHAIYTFAARWADTWNIGRLAIAGDAAHQMPPFAGQGMCSGLRDAANLSWKLDRVLRGASEPRLLDTYTSERSLHLQHAITMSVELGKVICVLDPRQAAQRDARMIADDADPAKVLPVTARPVLGNGIVAAECALGGTLAPQFAVEVDHSPQLLDTATGSGAVLLLHAGRPADQLLNPSLWQSLATVDGTAKSVAADGDPDLHDATGAWARWFDANAVAAVLIRPDHYIYGTAPHIDDGHDLLAGYAALLRLDSAAVPATGVI